MQTYTNSAINQNNFPQGEVTVDADGVTLAHNGKRHISGVIPYNQWLRDTNRLDSIIIYNRNATCIKTVVATCTAQEYWNEYPHDVIIADAVAYFVKQSDQ